MDQTLLSSCHQNGNAVMPRFLDPVSQLGYLDMNLETLRLRSIVCSNIEKHLSKRQEYHLFNQETREKLIRLFDEDLFARAKSKVDYLDMTTLESRLNDLLYDNKNRGNNRDLSFDDSSSSMDSIARGSEMPHMGTYPSDASYDNITTLSSVCGYVPSNANRTSILSTNTITGLSLGGGLSTSQRYLPNGHHRVVASASVPGWNVMNCSQTVLQPVSAVSSDWTGNRFVDGAVTMPPNYSIGQRDSGFLHSVRGNGQSGMLHAASSRTHNKFHNGRAVFATKSAWAIDGVAVPEQHRNFHPGNLHYLLNCNLSSSAKLSMPASAGSRENSKDSHLLGVQSNLMLNSVGMHLSCAENELLRKGQQQDLCSSYQWSCQTNDQYDHLELWQKDRYFKQQQEKSCIVPSRFPIMSQTVHDVTQHSQPSSVAAPCGSRTTEETTLGNLCSDKVHLLYLHALNCLAREGECAYPSCQNMKQHLNCISSYKDDHCPKQNEDLLPVVDNSHMFPSEFTIQCRQAPECQELVTASEGIKVDKRPFDSAFMPSIPSINSVEHEWPPSKRTKTDHLSFCHPNQNETTKDLLPVMDNSHMFPTEFTLQCRQARECQELVTTANNASECINLDKRPFDTAFMPSIPSIDSTEHEWPPSKRTKTDYFPFCHPNQNETAKDLLPVMDNSHMFPTESTVQCRQVRECQELVTTANNASEGIKLDKRPFDTAFMPSIPSINSVEHEWPPSKRTKTDHLSFCHPNQNETPEGFVPVMDNTHLFPDVHTQEFPHPQECEVLGVSVNDAVGGVELDKRSLITASFASIPTANMLEHEWSPLKHMKMEHLSLSHSSQNETAKDIVPLMNDTHLFPNEHNHEFPLGHEFWELSTAVNNGSEGIKVDKVSAGSLQESYADFSEVKDQDRVLDVRMKLNVECAGPEVNGTQPECESRKDSVMEIKTQLTVESAGSEGPTVTQPVPENMPVKTKASKDELEDKCMSTAACDIHVTGRKLGKQKRHGVSLVAAFTSEEVREHVNSLRKLVPQSKEQAELNRQMGDVTDNICSLCEMSKLRFEPPAVYCGSCSKKISPKGTYYTMRSIANGRGAHSFVCSKCYTIPGESVKVDGREISKANLERGRNYAETNELDERLVQCDKCKAWQHQICALFNAINNQAVEADYTCATCLSQEMQSGQHDPLQRVVLGAKDLSKTIMSDHIERWLFKRLEEERQERANSLGKKVNETPTAEGLVVRVVSSIDKKLEVKQAFLGIFAEKGYPSSFYYKSKAIMLFQKIDGADVCLFTMYVQEYGSGCAHPNRRHVCISYIDSVKYFRPRVAAATGEALRTFVYHEILIGYLDYCKRRGFTSCYIWACPPLKRDDYILYCHPIEQKIPKSEKLREWYQTIIRKAAKEKIIVEQTNLHDLFFVHTGECKAKVTATRLPYFDNDYWPEQAEILLQSKDGSKLQKNGRKASDERVLRAARREASIDNPKDVLLMHQLGESIRSMKGDFIMVRLQHACKHCCQPILSGEQWVCAVCKNFRLCEKCFSLDQALEKQDRHPISSSEKHQFHMVEVESVPADIVDGDGTIQSDFLDSRLEFLGHCQDNHYQFDTLRRAKYSTMMIIYGLHNPTPSALISSCIACHEDIDVTQGWHRGTCRGYDLCDSCYQKKGLIQHEHKLLRNSAVADHNLETSNVIQQGISWQTLSNVLAHASKCGNPRCAHQFCLRIKWLFRHGNNCKIRSSGGCKRCIVMWNIIQNHARGCHELECHVPRCSDVKEYRRKMLSKADNHRRAGNKDAMRNRIRKQRKNQVKQVVEKD